MSENDYDCFLRERPLLAEIEIGAADNRLKTDGLII